MLIPSFNPRPPLLAGESFVVARSDNKVVVSIRARHCWRANLGCVVQPIPKPLFQSAPAIAGGRILKQSPAQSSELVSIRARHCWRANPVRDAAAWRRLTVSIRARHCWRANRGMPRRPRMAREFQSAPAIAGGRININPGVSAASQAVSIRARHCWRANPPAPAVTSGSLPVSIRARHCWRANLTVAKSAVGYLMFQSAPAIAGGRIRGTGGGSPQVCVSIRARHCWRANR